MISNRRDAQVARAYRHLVEWSEVRPGVAAAGAAEAWGGEGAEELPAIHLLSTSLPYLPSHGELLGTYLQNFTESGVPKSRPVHALNIELVLSREEAMRGARLPVRVPLFEICRYCDGTGRAGFFQCGRCGGEGMREEFHQIDIFVPAGVQHDTVIPVSLKGLGVRNLYLNVRVRISELVSGA